MKTTRRGFLRRLISAPFAAVAGVIGAKAFEPAKTAPADLATTTMECRLINLDNWVCFKGKPICWHNDLTKSDPSELVEMLDRRRKQASKEVWEQINSAASLEPSDQVPQIPNWIELS